MYVSVNCSPLDFRQAVVSLLGQLTQTLSTYRSMDEDTTAGRYYGIAYLGVLKGNLTNFIVIVSRAPTRQQCFNTDFF